MFLGNLRDLAAAPTEKAEAAHELGIDPEGFDRVLADDLEAAAVWNQTRIDAVIGMKRQLRKLADRGKRYAIEAVLRILREGAVRPNVDFNRVELADVSLVCGVSRQTVHSWVNRFGAPQNADKTYSLIALWSWYEGFVAQRMESGKVKVPVEVSDPLRAETARMRKVQVEEALNRLLPRDEVTVGILARHQVFLNAVSGKPEEIAMSIAGQPADVVVPALQEFFDGIKGELCHVPDELRLDGAARAKMMELMEMIGGLGDDVSGSLNGNGKAETE